MAKKFSPHDFADPGFSVWHCIALWQRFWQILSMRKMNRSGRGHEAGHLAKIRWEVRFLSSAAKIVTSGLTLGVLAALASGAEPLENPFHLGTRKDQPVLTAKNRKRIEDCTADYQAVLCGKKPFHAQPDPSQESTETEQFYDGKGYQIHVTKSPVVIDGVRGFIYGPIIELDERLAEGEMVSLFHTAFYTEEEMKKADPAETPFHVGTGKDKPAWSEKAQERMEACMADYQALIEGQKPSHAKPGGKSGHFYQGEGYQIDLIKEPIVVAGVAGFLYGPMLDLTPDPLKPGDIDTISHITFYTADEMGKLHGTK